MLKKRVLRIISVLMILGISVVSSVMPVSAAPGYPDMEGYWQGKCRLKLYNMENERVAYYLNAGISITEQVDSLLTGELDIYEAASTRGSYIRNSSGICTGIRLAEGNNTINVTQTGTFTVYLPNGVTGTATSGTSTVNGSPQALVEGANTVTTSVSIGDFTLAVLRVPITVATITGVVGTGYAPRFELIGTQLYASVAEGTATITGAPYNIVPPGAEIDVTGAGSFTITLPEGMIGTATSGTATLTDSPVTLETGENSLTTGVTTGTVTVTIRATTGVIISGRARLNRDTSIRYVAGRLDGFYVADTDGWVVMSFGAGFRCIDVGD